MEIWREGAPPPLPLPLPLGGSSSSPSSYFPVAFPPPLPALPACPPFILPCSAHQQYCSPPGPGLAVLTVAWGVCEGSSTYTRLGSIDTTTACLPYTALICSMLREKRCGCGWSEVVGKDRQDDRLLAVHRVDLLSAARKEVWKCLE
eukprot:361335-Chlamydomonas_euryale.AAC.5